jgi:hypothetical protein
MCEHVSPALPAAHLCAAVALRELPLISCCMSSILLPMPSTWHSPSCTRTLIFLVWACGEDLLPLASVPGSSRCWMFSL